MIKAATAAILCLFVSIPTLQAQDPYFDGVMERLDLNGSFFTYFGSEHLVRELEQMVQDGLPAVLKLNGEFDEAEPFLQLGSKAYETSGLSALGGLGMSHTTLPNGVGRTKTVIRRGEGDGEGMVWNVFGKDILPKVKALPADTEAVLALGLRLDRVLNWAEGAIKGSPMEGPYQQTMDAMAEQVDIKQATKDLQDLVISVRLDPIKTVDYPFGDDGAPMTMPLIRAVAQASVEGDTIPTALNALFESLGLETTEQKIAGVAAQVLPEIMPNVQPCWVIKDGAILFASDPDALKDALKPAGKTLGDQDGFRKHLGGVPAANVAFYTSPELSRAFAKVQAQSLQEMEDAGEIPPEMESLMKHIMGGDGEPAGTFSATYQDGTFVESVSHTTGPKQLKLGVATTGILAAIMVPAVTKVIGDAKMTEMKTNGKNLYVVAFADAIDSNVVGFPTTKDGYKGTHEFFKAQAQGRNRVLAATPDFVSGPGVPAAASWDKIGPKNCAWQVVLDCDETTDAGTPYLISANLKIDTLGDDWLANLDRKGPMKGNVVIAYHGGGAEVIRPEDLARRQEDLLDFVDKKTKVLKP